jgi:hypothetical protein
VLAYAEASKLGCNEQDALIAAYDAYFAAAPDLRGKRRATYAADLKMPGKPNRAKQRIASTIRPALVRFGMLAALPPGRPKKQK